VSFGIKPGVDVSRPEAKPVAQFDGFGEVSAGGVAVIYGLHREAEEGGQCFGRHELLHESRV
jgi:hypothetical protein